MDLLGIARSIIGNLVLGKDITPESIDVAAKELSDRATKEMEKAVEDRVSARLLAVEEKVPGNAVAALLSSVHRPAWSFSALFLFIYSVIAPALSLPMVELGPMHEGIMQSVIGFYFGGRTIEKVVSIFKGGK